METLRHAKCHEVVMMWAHHLSETAKKFWKGKDLPTLPAYDAKKADNKVYATSTTCQTGHKMVAGGGTSTHKWPDWPEELHYTAKAHGAYPFWWGGGSDSGVADMEVWWSEKQGLHGCYWRLNVNSIVRLLHWHGHAKTTTNHRHRNHGKMGYARDKHVLNKNGNVWNTNDECTCQRVASLALIVDIWYR